MISSFVSLVLACGAPLYARPGAAGSAVFESTQKASVFNNDGNSISWGHLDLDASRYPESIMTIYEPLIANIETNERVNTAISATSEGLVLLDRGEARPIGLKSAIFGSTLDKSGRWQTIAYTDGEMTLISETAPGVFAKTAHSSMAVCNDSMLTLVEETSGRLVGVCGTNAVTVKDDVMQQVTLPAAATLRLDSKGEAIFVTKSSIVRVPADRAEVTAALSFGELDAAFAIAIDDHSIIGIDASGKRVAIANDESGSWQASAPHDLPDTFFSAAGSPVRVLSGSYTLHLDRLKDGQWLSMELSAIGVEPREASEPRGGCSATGEASLALFLCAFVVWRIRSGIRCSAAA